MDPLTRNGGMIGVTLDFESTEQYILGETTGYVPVTHVGTNVNSGTTGVSVPTCQEGDVVILSIASDNNENNDYRGDNTGSYARLHNNLNSANHNVFYQVMGAVPDTQAFTPTGDPVNMVCSVFRNVDTTSLPAIVSASALTGLPNPPATTTSPTTNDLIVVTGGLDDDDSAQWTPAAPTDFTLAGWNGSTNQNATALLAYRSGTGSNIDPSSFTAAAGAADDAWEATTIHLVSKIGTVTEYGNYKNSGIWDLQSVYDTLYIPTIATATYQDTGAVDGVARSSETFAGVTFGPTGANKQLVVFVTVYNTTVTAATLSVTAAGISMTPVLVDTAGAIKQAVFTLNNPATSGTIVVSSTDAHLTYSFAAYNVEAASATPTYSGEGTADEIVADVTRGGCLIVQFSTTNTTQPSLSGPTGFIQDYSYDTRSNEWIAGGTVNLSKTTSATVLGGFTPTAAGQFMYVSW